MGYGIGCCPWTTRRGAQYRHSSSAAKQHVHRTEIGVKVGLQLLSSRPTGFIGEGRPDNLLDAPVVDIYARAKPHRGRRGGDDGGGPCGPSSSALPSSKSRMTRRLLVH